MSSTIRAHFDGEHFVPDEPVKGIAPGECVEVRLARSSAPAANDDPLMRLVDFAVDTNIPDLAENADHYLYGAPKQPDAAGARAVRSAAG